MLMVGYAASVGGIGTPVGSPPNLIGIGLLRSSAGVEISFLTWMTLAIPMVLLMGGALFLLLHRLHPAGTTGADPGAMRTYIERQRTHLGPLRQGELNTMLAFALAVVLWTLPGTLAILGLGGTPLAGWMVERFPEAVVALVAAILLFLLPVRVRPWEPTLRGSDAGGIGWGTILLFGGGLALGTLMFETGVAGAMGESLTARLGGSTLWGLTFLSIILAVLLSETTSNTAAANMVIPVIIAVAFAAGVNPVPPALGACFGASFGFMLPVSTPPNAIIYGSGLVPIPKMMRAGVIFDLLGIGIIWLGLRIMCPLLGLS
jgi:sodium-dependent dicarboxylate transporter 2/3/5